MQYQAGAKRPNYVLPKGEYPARILKAEEKTSKIKPDGSGGNPMLVVELEVYDDDRTKRIRDYIVIGGQYSADWKIGHLAAACGLSADGNLEPSAIVERLVRVKLRIKKASGNYQEDNEVDDYIAQQAGDGTTAATASVAARKAAPPSSTGDDEPPF